MRIKDKFELMSTRGSGVYNILPFNEKTLKSFSLSKEEKMYVNNLVKMYIRSRPNTVGSTHVLNNLDSCTAVKLEDYPLPVFIDKKGNPYINTNILSQDSVSDYTPSDIYVLYLNALMLSNFLVNKRIPDGMYQDVSNYLYSVFMKMFGKKSGLLGSYKDLIPKLRFLVSLYTKCGLFGEPDTDDTRKKIASALYTSFDDLKMDYDFTSITGFINSLKENQIIPLSTVKFSQQVVQIGGVQSLPMFEDISRMFSTLPCSLVSGNTLYRSFWTKMPGTAYKKIVLKSFTLM
jgi:hypothetical protein